MKTYIKGNYKKSVFQSTNGYIIGIFSVKETNDPNMEDYINETVTFTGYFADLNINDTYIFYGDLIDHPKYGFQYQVSTSERLTPKDKDGIIEFLSSELFTGIGEKVATKIVNTLGNNALELILEDKNNLKKVEKLPNKKIDIIYDTLTKYEESHKIVVYLTELGFNMRDSLSIYNRYKENTKLMITNNIYNLIEDIEDITFSKVDEIYKKLENNLDDPNRIKACIIYTMKNLTFKNSDTYLYFNEIKEETLRYLKQDINDEQFNLYLDELRYDNKIVLESARYYLKKMFIDEEKIINTIKLLLNKEPTKYKQIDKLIKQFEEVYSIEYNSKQIEAIKKSLENNILVITGGPGTGKTTIIKAIVEMYQKLNDYTFKESLEHIALLAPTGRASKRMSETTLFPASTIHRYLKWNKETNSFGVDEFNKNEQELIIIDEVSMIDTNLFASLFRGLKSNIKLVLVGDYNQLPSVGPGQILKDIIESEIVDVIELDLLYRQSETSYISELAYEIKNNDISSNFLEKKDDYLFLECSSNSIKDNIINLSKQIMNKNYDYKKFQILAPMYAGINGIDNLNKELQNIFNPSDPDKIEIKVGDVIYRENDKVLQLVNMADSNVYNGDIGIIKYIIPFYESDSGKNEIYIDYDGIELKLLPNDFNKIKHGYIISIHKSQGSEFDMIMIPICKSYNRMLYKKLIYTGITRAKNKLILLGEKDAFIYSVRNNAEIIRKTTLKEKLQNMYKI